MFSQPTKRRRARAGELEGRHLNREAAGTTPTSLADIIANARTAVGRPGNRLREGEAFVPAPELGQAPQNIGHLSLRTPMPSLIDRTGRLYRTPPATPSATTATLRDAVFENSRVAKAGAKLIELAEPILADTSPQIAFQDQPTKFSIIEPAGFALVSLTPDAATNAVSAGPGTRDEGQVSASPLPIATAELDREALSQRAWRCEVSRSTLRARSDGEIAAEIMTSVALGLGRAVDATLLAAILATTPGAYSHAAAAGAGLRFADLRAIIGTNGAGAAPDRGELYVSGIPAETCADMAETVVAAWDRFAIVVQPEISVHIERTLSRGLVFSVWADFAAMVPDAGFAWTVA
jgi:hypothetical protein